MDYEELSIKNHKHIQRSLFLVYLQKITGNSKDPYMPYHRSIAWQGYFTPAIELIG